MCRGLAAVALLALASCSQSSRMTHRAVTITGANFQEMYASERSALSHADYLGQKDGYHYLAIVDTFDGSGCRAKYRFSVRTPSSELPPSFPNTPQKAITPFSGANAKQSKTNSAD